MTRTRFAPAKINLYLHVGPPRADGLHPLDSLVMFARHAGDTVTVEEGEGLSLIITGPFADELPVSDDNLVLRAAHLFAAHAGVPAQARIGLDKHLPIASGIGGGSADAAAALHALNDLWNARASIEDLAVLGAQLGSDIPACVHARTARMSGIGADTRAVACAPLHAVLVNPRAPAPTGAVYRAFDDAKLGKDLTPVDDPPAGDARAWLAAQRNDLEPAAVTVAPAVGEVLDVLREFAPDALARMSGSGATCFAIAATEKDAAALGSRLAAARPAWWVRPTLLG